MNGQYPRSMLLKFGMPQGLTAMNCIILGRVKNGWSGIVMLWEFKSNICFVYIHDLEFGV